MFAFNPYSTPHLSSHIFDFVFRRDQLAIFIYDLHDTLQKCQCTGSATSAKCSDMPVYASVLPLVHWQNSHLTSAITHTGNFVTKFQ